MPTGPCPYCNQQINLDSRTATVKCRLRKSVGVVVKPSPASAPHRCTKREHDRGVRMVIQSNGGASRAGFHAELRNLVQCGTVKQNTLSENPPMVAGFRRNVSKGCSLYPIQRLHRCRFPQQPRRGRRDRSPRPNESLLGGFRSLLDSPCPIAGSCNRTGSRNGSLPARAKHRRQHGMP